MRTRPKQCFLCTAWATTACACAALTCVCACAARVCSGRRLCLEAQKAGCQQRSERVEDLVTDAEPRTRCAY